MGSTSFDGISPAKTGSDAVIHSDFRGTFSRVMTRPGSGR
jgi:hypothetical protein